MSIPPAVFVAKTTIFNKPKDFAPVKVTAEYSKLVRICHGRTEKSLSWYAAK